MSNRATLKGYFNTGDTPTEANFADLIDSLALTTENDGKADVSHSHTASQISDASTAGRALLTAADVNAQLGALGVSTTAQMNAAIAAAINALVAGAPSALDTLDELSAALNDDANAITAILASLAAKPNNQRFAILTESTTARTLILTDADKYIRCTNAAATTITIPLQATVAWAADTEVLVEQGGDGQVTIAGAGGVTVNTSQTLKTRAKYAVISLKRIAANTWVCGGEREAV